MMSESWGSEVEIENPSSEIGGHKALASHGSEGSSRERALARSLASSIYMYIYMYKVHADIIALNC